MGMRFQASGYASKAKRSPDAMAWLKQFWNRLLIRSLIRPLCQISHQKNTPDHVKKNPPWRHLPHDNPLFF